MRVNAVEGMREDNEGESKRWIEKERERGKGAGDVCTLKYYSQMKYRAGPAGTQRARIFLDLI